ncbi:DUF6000 family protein [Aliikangiella sp. IMCC44359]|uniref:DUF6000 family protein n=1 Tax=Aliikangiella sp. IMCC44359 TaxID=3459125 RepID=UPI00403ACE43
MAMKITERIKELMKLHSAGATVRNNSPFSDIETSLGSDEYDPEELRKWVFPSPGAIYGLDKSEEFLKLCPTVTPEIVLALLAEFNWRDRITAACYSAVLGLNELETEIGNLLLKSEVCYAGKGYCVALASFNSKGSIAYLNQYLDYYLTQIDKCFDQGTAMGALAYLDNINGTELVSTKLELWNEFVNDKEYWQLEDYISDFEEQMKSVKNLKEQLNAI